MRTLLWLLLPLLALTLSACTFSNAEQIEVDEMRKEKVGLERKIAALEKTIAQIKADQAAQAKELEEEKQTAEKNEDTSEDLAGQVARATEYINTLRTDIAARDRQIVKLKADLAAATLEAERLRAARLRPAP